jgi:hypothetical protein
MRFFYYSKLNLTKNSAFICLLELFVELLTNRGVAYKLVRPISRQLLGIRAISSGFLFFYIICFAFTTNLLAQSASVQVVNLSTALSSLDVYARGEKVVNGLGPNKATMAEQWNVLGVISVAVARGGSSSAAQQMVAQSVMLQPSSINLIVLQDDPDAVNAVKITVFKDLRAQPKDAKTSAVDFMQASDRLPKMHIVIRDGAMVVNNLGVDQVARVDAMPFADNFLDIKNAATNDLIGTYRLSLQATEGSVNRIVMTGNPSTPESLKMFSIFKDGFVLPLDVAPVSRVQYVNGMNATVDIFKNGTRFADNAARGSALAYKYIPSGVPINIAVSSDLNTSTNGPLPAYGMNTYTFVNMTTYSAVSAGELNSTTYPPTMFLKDGLRERALDTNRVELMVFNGLSQRSGINITIDTDNRLPVLPYGGFSNYISLSAASHQFRIVTDEGTVLIAPFERDMRRLKGKAVFLYCIWNAMRRAELWMAEADGTSVNLSGLVSTKDFGNPYNIVCYPTLATHNLNVQKDSEERLRYTLYDMHGKTLKQGILNERLESITLEGISTGSYFMSITGSNFTQNFKFIKCDQ